jgi:DNA-directed RNA polymerase subunit RPC12/RpoP
VTSALAYHKTKKSVKNIIRSLLVYPGDPIEAARARLELLNTVHRRLHRLEFDEFLKKVLKVERNDSIKESLKLLESTDKKIHRLWFSELSKVGLEPDGRLKLKQLWKLKSDYLWGDFGSFRLELQKEFKFLGNEQGELLILEIIDATATLAEYIENRLQKGGFARRDSLYDYLYRLHNHFKDKPVQHCFEPLKGENGLYDSNEVLASEILQKTEAERGKERYEVDSRKTGLLEELRQLNPPLTWGEVLFYFIEDDVSTRGKLNGLFFPPGNRYCLQCNKFFLLSKNNPGYFRCPQCSARIRQRRKRERERHI